MRYWTKKFNPKMEDISYAPAKIMLYSLPQEYWHDQIFEGIGNTLGTFVKIAEATKQGRYTTYARICAYMNISKPIPESICLSHHDSEWMQTLDYEHVPFRCCKCHEHRHLFRYCHLNIQPQWNQPPEETDVGGFVKVSNKKKPTKKPRASFGLKGMQTKNTFTILGQSPNNS